MHVVCLYQHYCNPDCAAGARAYTVLRHLAQRHRITLVTMRAWYERRLTQRFDWVPPGVDVHMLAVPYRNRMNVQQRLRAYLEFPVRALLQGLREAEPDLVYGISTPLTTGWAASRLAQWYNVPWIFEVRDLWPDFPIQMGAVRSAWLQRRLYALERRLYETASQVVTVSPDMTEHVRQRGIRGEKVCTLLQGTDFDLLTACGGEETEAIRQRYDLEGRRVVLYAGTFGRANDMPTLLAAARGLAHRSDLRFVFVGHGYHEPLLREAAQQQANVLVVPPQPRHQIFHWFKLASVSVVSFIDLPVLATNAPSKFFDSLAAGTPVIVTNPGWTKRFVEEHECGWYVPPSDPGALAACVDQITKEQDTLERAGRRGGAIAREQFDRVQMAERLEAILEQAAND